MELLMVFIGATIWTALMLTVMHWWAYRNPGKRIDRVLDWFDGEEFGAGQSGPGREGDEDAV